jgi:hypothetical protein
MQRVAVELFHCWLVFLNCGATVHALCPYPTLHTRTVHLPYITYMHCALTLHYIHALCTHATLHTCTLHLPYITYMLCAHTLPYIHALCTHATLHTCTVHLPYITYMLSVDTLHCIHALCRHATLHTHVIFLLSFYPSTVALSLTSHVNLPWSGKHSKALHALCTHMHTCTPVCGSVFTLTSIQTFYCLNIKLLSQEHICILSASCVTPCASLSLCIGTNTNYFNYSFVC